MLFQTLDENKLKLKFIESPFDVEYIDILKSNNKDKDIERRPECIKAEKDGDHMFF